jgi:hypothetical protein
METLPIRLSLLQEAEPLDDLMDASLVETNGHPLLRAPVVLAEPVGSEVIVHLELDAPQLGPDAKTFTARLGPRCSAKHGELLTLAVDPATLYFFDPETETALR